MVEDDEGLLGDRANKGAIRAILGHWRKPLRKAGDDPFGDEPSENISRKTLDALLAAGNPEAAGVLQGAIDDFAQEFALLIRRFLKLKAWHDTERIVVGGGFRASRVGELTISRAAVILKPDKVPIDLLPVRNDPDEAGLIGAAHLAPRWTFEAHDAILAVDIGGTNIRAGVVALNLKKAALAPSSAAILDQASVAERSVALPPVCYREGAAMPLPSHLNDMLALRPCAHEEGQLVPRRIAVQVREMRKSGADHL